MERKENNAIYETVTGIAKVIRDNVREQRNMPRKVSINVDNLVINMSNLKYPIKFSAKIDMDFSGKKKDSEQ